MLGAILFLNLVLFNNSAAQTISEGSEHERRAPAVSAAVAIGIIDFAAVQ